MPPWKKVKLGDAVEIIKDTYQPSDKDDFDYIGLEHIEQQSLRLNSIWKSINISSGKFKFKTGDILFGKLRPYFRKVVIPNFPGVCSTDIWVIRAKEGFDQKFLFYLLASETFIEMSSSGSTLSILSNKFIVKSNSILFSKLNPRFPRVWMIGNINESTSICSTEFLVIKPKLGYWYSFIYQTLCFKILTDSLTSIATGTSGSHQRIKPDDILKTEIFIPSEYDGIQFESNVRPFLKRIIKNNIENEILTIMRDNLLPKLMNGELTIDSVSLEESPKAIVA